LLVKYIQWWVKKIFSPINFAFVMSIAEEVSLSDPLNVFALFYVIIRASFYNFSTFFTASNSCL